MNRLNRTRSQHFVASPRKVASPMKHKLGHALGLGRNTKRRRVGTSGVATVGIDDEEDLEEVENDDQSSVRRNQGRGRDKSRGWEPLSSEGGLQRVNRGTEAFGGKGEKGRGRASMMSDKRDVFDGSPRKRKRGSAPVSVVQETMEQDEMEDGDEGAGSQTGGSVAGSGSWIEIDDEDQDEEEPEFIAESDQHLLADAPAYALHRLKKAELIRLWKVAGMWKEDDDVASTNSTGDDDGLGKRDLVEGLIAARNPLPVRHISGLPSPRNSPRTKAILAENGPSRSYTSLPSHLPVASPSPSLSPPPPERSAASALARSRSRVRVVIDATPRPTQRNRSKLKLGRNADGTPHGSSKIIGRSATKSKRNGRTARFGDDVKSPAHGLLSKRERQTSSLSSIYTTTDGSDTGEVQAPRTTRRTRKRGQSLSVRDARAESEDEELEATDVEEGEDEEEDKSMPDPTPLVARLRSRTKSLIDIPPPSEPDADDEDEDTEEEDDDASPGPSQRTRSQNQLIESSESSRSSGDRVEKSLPNRGAKAKALRAIRSDIASSPEIEEDEEMEVDEDVATESTSEQEEDGDEDEVENDTADDGGDDIDTENDVRVRPDKSRKRKLRQEALEDPDMEAEIEEDEEGEEDEEEQDDDDAMEDTSDDGSVDAFDMDLEDASISSLTRLLRNELVQLCEARGIEVGGTKPQLAKALLEWRDEQKLASESPTSSLSSSSQVTARPSSPKESISRPKSKASKSRKNKVIHAIGSNKHVKGKTTPVLLRDHVHATDPATPQISETDGKQGKDTELNFDLAELGLEDSIILPEHLTKLERIGSGGFKDVYVGKCKGRKVAISEFRSHLSEMDIRELKLLAEFSHPNIVRFRGICIPEDSSQVQCMLVSELCENGDLFDYIRNVGTPTLRRLLGLMLDIARGLEYLHTRRPAIIHRDCKSSNILINRAGQAKVGDFGLARVKTSTRSMINSLVGTVNWQAPELWHAAPRYDYKVDVFSAGLVYWEMMSGWTGEKKYPWEGHNEHYIYDVVGQKSKRPSVAGLRKQWGVEPVNLMERMWHQDPAERPTMSDVVADLEALIAEL